MQIGYAWIEPLQEFRRPLFLSHDDLHDQKKFVILNRKRGLN